MSIPPALALTFLALAPVAAGDTPGVPDGGPDAVQLAQLTIHERIIIRVPRIDPAPPPEPDAPPPAQRWVERKGPKCMAMMNVTGAQITAADQVDLMLNDGGRIRARLDDACPSLNFYSGFYLRQTADGMVCAGRDAFRTRSGGMCPIREFRALRPRRWLDNLPLIRKR